MPIPLSNRTTFKARLRTTSARRHAIIQGHSTGPYSATQPEHLACLRWRGVVTPAGHLTAKELNGTHGHSDSGRAGALAGALAHRVSPTNPRKSQSPISPSRER